MTDIRVLIKNGIYHVYNRGNNGMDIFHSDKDKYVFLKQIKAAQQKFGFSIFAICLMSNHFHLLIKDNDKSLSDIMNLIQSNYTKHHNPEYNFKGHLFQGRFQYRIINDDNDFFTVVRYILRNPVAAGMTIDIYEYFWATTCANHDKYNLIDFDYLFNTYEKFSNIPFSEFISNSYEDKFLAQFEVFRMNNKNAEIVFYNILNSFSIENPLRELSKKEIDEIICECIYRKITKRQISIFTGLSMYRIKQVDIPKFKYI